MIKAIVTDIEGTTSSIAFVKDTLFPYAAEKLPAFIRDNLQDPSIAEQLVAAAEESGIEANNTDALINRLLQWIREDKKMTPLKALQGMVWKYGYEQGDYQAHVYDDAVAQLRNWHQQGIPLYVYSSGSIAAQQLFFQYSEAGDLAPLFAGHFDTTTGPKQETESYLAIANKIGTEAGDILFLSDIRQELDAARAAGMQTRWLIRAADSSEDPEQDSQHKIVSSFEKIILEQ